MTKFREHRGLLHDSLNTTVDIKTITELASHLNRLNQECGAPEIKDDIEIEKYGSGIDERCGWDTHIVTVGGCARGFTDGPLSK